MAKKNPDNLKYTREHEWLKIVGKEVVCGITDHAQELLTDIVFVELPALDETVAAGDKVAVLESVKSVSDVYSPISGTISAINENLTDNPGQVNQDAFGAGWIYKLTPDNLGDIDKLMTAKEYEAFLKE